MAASRTWTASLSASPLKVMPPATVVGANDGAPVACHSTAPRDAVRACTLGSCMEVSAGFEGSQSWLPFDSKRPKSPIAVDATMRAPS